MATSNATVTKVTVKMRKMEGTTKMKRRTKKKKKSEARTQSSTIVTPTVTFNATVTAVSETDHTLHRSESVV